MIPKTDFPLQTHGLHILLGEIRQCFFWQASKIYFYTSFFLQVSIYKLHVYSTISMNRICTSILVQTQAYDEKLSST